jgi:predicted esterase
MLTMTVHQIETRTHGRYLVDVPSGDGPFPLLVGFHGYAEGAEQMMKELVGVRGVLPWLLVSVQALNRFYTKGGDVVANWMTREDRELAIADNIAYVTSVVAAVRVGYRTTPTLVYAGFSQGVAMAYRAAAFAAPADGGIMLAGDVPPDVVPRLAELPPILIGRGETDHWYTAEKAAADLALYAAAGVAPSTHTFDGGHVWEESFVTAARDYLEHLKR